MDKQELINFLKKQDKNQLKSILKELGLSSLGFEGKYSLIHKNKDNEIISVDYNIVPNEGLNLINQILFNGLSAPSLFGVLTQNNYIPLATDTMASFLSSASEFTGYSETTRPQYIGVTTGVNTTNAASKMEYTINANGTIRGVALSTSGVKGGTTGTGFSFLLLSSPKTVSIGDTVALQYDFTSYSE